MSTAIRPARRRTARQFVPPQHGAWVMLLLPYVVGIAAAGFRIADLPLLGAWLAGYLLSYFALLALKTRRPQRFREQLVWYGCITAVLAVPVLVVAPQVLLLAPAYAVLLGVNAWYAHRRRERALLNDVASVVQSCLMVFVVAAVAGRAPREVMVPFLVVLLYLAGTVLYVKTMIRERGSRAYRHASVAYHAVALVVAATLGPMQAAVFALLLARAWLLAGRPLSPRQVGLAEIGATVLVLVAALA
jgi:hypothetical protein